jgi:hypothetical protein
LKILTSDATTSNLDSMMMIKMKEVWSRNLDVGQQLPNGTHPMQVVLFILQAP